MSFKKTFLLSVLFVSFVIIALISNNGSVAFDPGSVDEFRNPEMVDTTAIDTKPLVGLVEENSTQKTTIREYTTQIRTRKSIITTEETTTSQTTTTTSQPQQTTKTTTKPKQTTKTTTLSTKPALPKNIFVYKNIIISVNRPSLPWHSPEDVTQREVDKNTGWAAIGSPSYTSDGQALYLAAHGSKIARPLRDSDFGVGSVFSLYDGAGQEFKFKVFEYSEVLSGSSPGSLFTSLGRSPGSILSNGLNEPHVFIQYCKKGTLWAYVWHAKPVN